MEGWVQIIFETNRFHCAYLLTHYSILPAFQHSGGKALRPMPLAFLQSAIFSLKSEISS